LKLRNRILVPTVLLVTLFAVAGCKKKVIPPPPPPPPPIVVPTAPTAILTASPTVITEGDQIQLSWKTTDATSVTIDGIGDVPTSGVKTLTPAATTGYHLVAKGAGGSVEATASVTVNPKPVVVVPVKPVDPEVEFKANVQDIFFDYDKYAVTDTAQAALSKAASYLVSHADIKVVIGGYCDERGSDEYNLALGQNRANAAQKALVTAGVPADRLRIISYGKEKPFCTESTEDCWQQNRRAGFSIDK